MTPRILPGSIVRYDGRDWSVLSTIRKAEILRCNIRCENERLADIPAGVLELIAPPPAIPRTTMRGLA